MLLCLHLQLNVKFGRALQKGECKVKIYQLSVNDAEVSAINIRDYN